MKLDIEKRQSFEEFVECSEAALRHALIAALGGDVGRDAAAQAMLYGLENWDRVRGLDNPAGYLFRVGQRWGKRAGRRTAMIVDDVVEREPLVEPGLVSALDRLPASQRVAVVLRHGDDMSYSDIAALTGTSAATARKHVERGLRTLRRVLEVGDE